MGLAWRIASTIHQVLRKELIHGTFHETTSRSLGQVLAGHLGFYIGWPSYFLSGQTKYVSISQVECVSGSSGSASE